MPQAMVKPVPDRPAQSARRLAELLQQLGNTRAYTVIRYHNHSWKIMLEGDTQPCIVKVENGHPVIIFHDKNS